MDEKRIQNKKEITKAVGKKKTILLKSKTLFKKKKGTTGKYKTSNYEKVVRKLNDNRHICKAIVNKRLTTGRLKPRLAQEGMYLKGLRTHYIVRGTLNETNEARKNEDINKIIDIGRLMTANGLQGHRKSDCSKATNNLILQDQKKTSALNDINSTSGNFVDFERCAISPIGPSNSSGVENDFKNTLAQSTPLTEEESKNQLEKWEINFQESFKKFSLLSEEMAASKILSKFPTKGVLETALESLKDLRLHQQQKRKGEISVNDFSEEHQFMSGYELILQNVQKRNSVQHEVDDQNRTAKNDLCSFPEQEITFNSFTPFQNVMELQRVESESCVLPNSDNVVETKNIMDDIPEMEVFGNSKEFGYVTPLIQFYRRNMF